ncbi:hypothetical protein [Paraburkholderia sp. BR14320]|uniref:hypothetical protein n=1 Tax=unclassified Paraburkholderia TaxID=2615204 RepID=UPI0034CDB1EF
MDLKHIGQGGSFDPELYCSVEKEAGPDNTAEFANRPSTSADRRLSGLPPSSRSGLSPRPNARIRVESDVSPYTGEKRVFVEQKDALHIQGRNGHFYPIPQRYIFPFQRSQGTSFSFTPTGLDSLRRKYDMVHGVPPFLYDLLSLNTANPHLKQITMTPHLYPYLKDERFLIVHNTSHDPTFQALKNPRAQKLKNEAVMLCGWFIHPHLNCLKGESLQLLEELSDHRADKPIDRPILKKLQTTYVKGEQNTDVLENLALNSEPQRIGELRNGGEYLASILDLNRSHIPLLKSLRDKALHHLQAQYGVDEHDDVDLYFHFPYPDSTTTLHLHIRANQGLHPLEKAKSFTLDELIDGFSSGKKIDDIILERQVTYDGKIFRDPGRSIAEFQNLKGVTVSSDSENIHRLKRSSSQPLWMHSRDDLFVSDGLCQVDERRLYAYR